MACVVVLTCAHACRCCDCVSRTAHASSWRVDSETTFWRLVDEPILKVAFAVWPASDYVKVLH